MTNESPRLSPLLDEPTIHGRVGELAARISRDYAGTKELCVVGVLKGVFIFMADLCRRLTVPHRVDFVALSSYGDAAHSDGSVRLIMDLRTDVAGKHVLVVDDIIDTGSTLGYLKGMLAAHRPASVRTCVLVRKSKTKRIDLQPNYLGFEIDDVWVVGYGLDYADTYRTLPYIAVLDRP